MNRIFWVGLLFASLLTGTALKGELPTLPWIPSWDQAGCEMDPLGCPEPQKPTTDAGCEADPDGRPVCRPGS